jgi:DNA-binding beta-propeller fold protein YncE
MKKRLEKSAKLVSCLLAVSLLLAAVIPQNVLAAADLPYDSYNYDYWEYVHFTPAPYVPAGNISTMDMTFNGEPVGKMNAPRDVCRSPLGEVYIADTGNNRILVFDAGITQVVDVITSFDNGGNSDTFSQPSGVCVSEKGQLYIADSQNHRIVVLEADKSLVKIVENPQSESLEDGYVFIPLKVAVDYADRIYVVAQNMFEGLMIFESNGNFTSFFGTIQVNITLWDKFWKRIATKEERSKQQLFIPTEFTGIDVDEEGFVYATNIDLYGEQGVRRLNPKGEDVIKKGENLNLGGDIWTSGNTDYAGKSQFADVCFRGKGIYSCLDRRRGRIFTYDHEGNLLYIFGGLGTQEGTFLMPAAIEQMEDGLMVLDSARSELLVFRVTEYGDLINQAIGLRYDGDETLAIAMWERVLELDENNELANVGIGKAFLTAGDYPTAMYYLKLGMNSDYYSIAFRRYRNDLFARYASVFLTTILVLVVAFQVWKRIRRRRAGEEEEGGLLNG